MESAHTSLVGCCGRGWEWDLSHAPVCCIVSKCRLVGRWWVGLRNSALRSLRLATAPESNLTRAAWSEDLIATSAFKRASRAPVEPIPGEKNEIRVAIYGRVSNEKGGQDTETQMAQLREYCRAQQ